MKLEYLYTLKMNNLIVSTIVSLALQKEKHNNFIKNRNHNRKQEKIEKWTRDKRTHPLTSIELFSALSRCSAPVEPIIINSEICPYGITTYKSQCRREIEKLGNHSGPGPL